MRGLGTCLWWWQWDWSDGCRKYFSLKILKVLQLLGRGRVEEECGIPSTCAAPMADFMALPLTAPGFDGLRVRRLLASILKGDGQWTYFNLPTGGLMVRSLESPCLSWLDQLLVVLSPQAGRWVTSKSGSSSTGDDRDACPTGCSEDPSGDTCEGWEALCPWRLVSLLR